MNRAKKSARSNMKYTIRNIRDSPIFVMSETIQVITPAAKCSPSKLSNVSRPMSQNV
jgi:hypothetical protein